MAKSKRLALLLLLLCTCSIELFAQQRKYFIEFIDKNNSPFSLQNPADYLSQRSIDRRFKQNININVQDLPVNPAYIQAVQNTGASVWYTSRWMNAALIEADAAAVTLIQALPFVKQELLTNWQPVSSYQRPESRHPGTNSATSSAGTDFQKNARTQALDYGFSLNQITMIGADKMHEQGFAGKGMRIAIFDSGFRNANNLAAFSGVFTENRVLATYDFVRREQSVYEDDEHGLRVFSAMAAFVPGQIIGTAYEAEYVLLRTEDASSEYRIEEINWLMAAEYADSAGVDVINSSLGYNVFNNPAMSYSQADMDGNTALVTRAADMAAARGMLVVVSAGNEGDDAWQTISAPADADSVLAIGAVDKDRFYAPFSSRGPSADGQVKPDIAAQGRGTVLSSSTGNTIASNGTSFSSPLLAGMAASFWQAYPQLTNMEVIEYLRRSGSQAATPDTLLGYGIPDFTKAALLVENDMKHAQDICRIWPNPASENVLTLWVNPAYKKQALTIHIFDATGRLIDTQTIASANIENRLVIKSQMFTKGTYLVRVSSPQIKWITKLVIL